MPQVFLQTFFARFPSFTWDPIQPPTSEFHRLARPQVWDPATKEREVPAFRGALEKEFKSLYGKYETLAVNWQSLCRVLNIHPIPREFDHCKQVRQISFDVFQLRDE